MSGGALVAGTGTKTPGCTPFADLSQRDALVTIPSWRPSKPPATSWFARVQTEEIASSGLAEGPHLLSFWAFLSPVR